MQPSFVFWEGVFYFIVNLRWKTVFFALSLGASGLCLTGRAAAQTVRDEFEQGRAIARLEEFYDEARALGPLKPRAHG